MANSVDLDIPRMVQEFLSDLIQAVTSEIPDSDRDWHEVEYGEEFELERIERMISIQRFDNGVERTASKLLGGINLDLDAVPTLQRRQLLDGVARAQRERIYYQRHVRTQPFSKYVYHDPDLEPAELQLASNGTPPINPSAPVAPLSKFVEDYLSSDAHGWTEATRKEKQVPLSWFIELIGAKRDIKDIAPSDILAFRDAVLRLRKHVPAGTPLSKAQTDIAATLVRLLSACEMYVARSLEQGC